MRGGGNKFDVGKGKRAGLELFRHDECAHVTEGRDLAINVQHLGLEEGRAVTRYGLGPMRSPDYLVRMHRLSNYYSNRMFRAIVSVIFRFPSTEPNSKSDFQPIDPLAYLGRDRDCFHIGKAILHFIKLFRRSAQVHFVGNYVPRPLRQTRIEEIDFASQILQIFNRMPAFAAGGVDDEKQYFAARYMPQEVVAESNVAVRAFDQAGNISDRGAMIRVELTTPTIGCSVVNGYGSDFRPRRRKFS